MLKLNLVIGIVIFAAFSILISNIVGESFSQTVSNNNTKKDVMGNFINYTTSLSNTNNNNLTKDYPTNASK